MKNLILKLSLSDVVLVESTVGWCVFIIIVFYFFNTVEYSPGLPSKIWATRNILFFNRAVQNVYGIAHTETRKGGKRKGHPIGGTLGLSCNIDQLKF